MKDRIEAAPVAELTYLHFEGTLRGTAYKGKGTKYKAQRTSTRKIPATDCNKQY